MRYKGGFNTYGVSIGVLIVNKPFPRPPGDAGNATTFDFPVRYRVVKESTGDRHRKGDPALLEPFIKAAKELEAEGVKAICTTCGFLGVFQRELAAAISVPVFASSLLQIPMISRMLRPDQKVGILTADASNFGERLLEGVGAKGVPVVVRGLEDKQEFREGILVGRDWLDVRQVEQEVVSAAKEMDVEKAAVEVAAVGRKMLAEEPSIGAFVMESACLPPYSKALRDATGLPVFDFITLINWVYSAVVQRTYAGYL